MLNIYNQLLKDFPIPVNMITSFIVFFFGSFVSQSINKLKESEDKYDVHNMGIMGLYGAIVSILSIFWYRLIDMRIMENVTKMVFMVKDRRAIDIGKVIIDQTLWSPIITLFYLTYIALFQKISIVDNIKSNALTMYASSLFFWVPLMIINFLFVPSNLRIIFNNFSSFIWVLILLLLL